MKFMVPISSFLFFMVLFFAGCNNSSEIENKYIELSYCLHVDDDKCTASRIEGYIRFFSSSDVKIETEKSAPINNLCLLISRYDKFEYNIDHKGREMLLIKIEPKVRSSKYSYTFYKDCRDLFGLEFVNPMDKGFRGG